MFFVYVDCTMEERPRPFYVGKGIERRVRRLTRNRLHQRIAEKYGQRRVVMLVTKNECEAFDFERKLITKYKTFMNGGDGWWGANLTLGGEGSTGRVQSPEECQKHRQALLGIKRSEATKALVSRAIVGERNPNFGKKYTHDERQKLSRAQPTCIQVQQYTLSGDLHATWSAIRDAARELGLNASHISACCRGKRNHVGGFTWRYL